MSVKDIAGLWFIGEVVDVSDGLSEGRVVVTHPDLGEPVPCEAAAPPGNLDTASIGEGDQVMFGYFKDPGGDFRWIWSQQVYGAPDFSKPDISTSIQGYPKHRTPDPDSGLPHDGTTFLTKGNDESRQGYMYDALPGRKVWTDKRGNKIIAAFKESKQKISRFLKVRSARGKQLLLDDSPAGGMDGESPLDFPNPINPQSRKDNKKTRGNRIVLSDEKNNRLHINTKDSVGECYAANGWNISTTNGDIEIAAKSPKGMGDVRVQTGGKGSIFNTSKNGSFNAYGRLGFDMIGCASFGSLPAVGIVGLTHTKLDSLSPEPPLPLVGVHPVTGEILEPNLTMGVGYFPFPGTTSPQSDPEPGKLEFNDAGALGGLQGSGWLRLSKSTATLNAPSEIKIQTDGPSITVTQDGNITIEGLTDFKSRVLQITNINENLFGQVYTGAGAGGLVRIEGYINVELEECPSLVIKDTNGRRHSAMFWGEHLGF